MTKRCTKISQSKVAEGAPEETSHKVVDSGSSSRFHEEESISGVFDARRRDQFPPNHAQIVDHLVEDDLAAADMLFVSIHGFPSRLITMPDLQYVSWKYSSCDHVSI